MMKSIKILSFFLFVSLVLVSCKKDDDGGGDPQAASGTLTAKVNGTSFTSLEIATTANEVTGNGVTTITIQGSDANGKGVVMIINGYSGVGSYEISDSNTIFNTATYIEANISNPANSQSWMAPFQNSGVAGEINISEKNDTTIKGTFSFEAKNANDNSTKSITEGSFNMNLMQN
ncbi:MAG: DUF6252 family protein [Flavobacteriaceae bacterium]